MGSRSLWLRRRHVGHGAIALAVSLTTLPVVLGALAEPAAAATTPASSSLSAQQVVADVQCDIAWIEYDNTFTNDPVGDTPPSCAPVPVAFQVAFSNLWFDYCEFTNQLGGNHGICIPPADAPTD